MRLQHIINQNTRPILMQLKVKIGQPLIIRRIPGVVFFQLRTNSDN